MCRQDKAFSNAYDREYIIDPKKKRAIIVDKILEIIKGKGKMTSKEQKL